MAKFDFFYGCKSDQEIDRLMDEYRSIYGYNFTEATRQTYWEILMQYANLRMRCVILD